MARGIISWLTVRGFGFIDQGTREDLFFRGTALENVAFAALRVGDRVEFDATPDPHAGDQAVHVRRIEAQPPLADRTPEHAR